MPSEFPRSPRLLKGALVVYDSQFLGPVPNVIVFQYNPEQLSRTLTRRTPEPDYFSWGASRQDVFKTQGPPVEAINLTVVLDATDQLEAPAQHPAVVRFGLHPALAALELLLYPPSSQVLLNSTLAQAGSTLILREDVPLVLFVWGISRVLPVRLTSFTITEQAFDPALNPIQAEVALGMQVLTYVELNETSLARGAYIAQQVLKEGLARLNLANSAEQILGMLPF